MDLRERASNMETQQKHIPQLRFPEFQNDGEWEVKRLGEIAERIITRNKDNEVYPVLTNSATEGVINQQDYFDREIVSKDKLTNYHIIKFDDFVYNPRISTTAPVGPISRNKIGTGIMSPLYTIFRFKVGNIDFFEQYFRTNCWHQYLKDRANFGARFDRMNITSEDFLKLPLPYPSLAEQCHIAAVLSEMDTLLSATRDKLEQLKAYKKGLMQKLIPAKGKTLPEYRFKEFEKDGEWKVMKLGEIITEVKDTTNDSVSIPLYSLTIDEGITAKNEKYERGFLVTKKDNVFKVVSPNDFVSNPMNLRFGAIGCNHNTFSVCVSGYYDVFRFKESGSSVFWVNYLKSDLLLHKYDEIAIGSLIEKRRVYYSNLQNLSVLVPTIQEQRKIADCLSLLDEIINAYAEKVVQFGQYKKGLMQQMFPTSK